MIYRNVDVALQAADEMGGPELPEYIDLMERVISLATKCRSGAVQHQLDDLRMLKENARVQHLMDRTDDPATQLALRLYARLRPMLQDDATRLYDDVHTMLARESNSAEYYHTGGGIYLSATMRGARDRSNLLVLVGDEVINIYRIPQEMLTANTPREGRMESEALDRAYQEMWELDCDGTENNPHLILTGSWEQTVPTLGEGAA